MLKKTNKKIFTLAFCSMMTLLTVALIFETPSHNIIQSDASVDSGTSFSLNNDEYTELGKQMMNASVSSSTKTSSGQSVQYSFTTGYSSFSCSMVTTSLEIGPDLTGDSGTEFQKFYYDGENGKKAFSQMDSLDLENRTKELKENPSDGVAVYDAFIRSLNYTTSIIKDYANKLFIPRAVYRTDNGVPYRTEEERKTMTDEETCTPVLTLNNDHIYCMDSVVYFGLLPIEIASRAYGSENGNKVKQIIIPKNITKIHSDSFSYSIEGKTTKIVKPSADCVFKMEMSEADVHALEEIGQFEEGWNAGCQVEYDFDYVGTYEQDLDASIIPQVPLKTQISTRNAKRYISYPSTGVGKSYDINPDPKMVGNNNYIFGSYGEGNQYKPFTAVFSIYDKTSETPIGTLTYEFPKPDSYYSVGEQIYKFNNALFADIDFRNLKINLLDGSSKAFDDKTMAVDPSNCCLLNIFHATKQSDGAYTPDLDKPYKATTGDSLKVIFSKIYNSDEFVTLEYLGYSTFIGFTAINMKLTRGLDDLYIELNPSSYARYKNEIDSGKVRIRFRFDSLKQSSFTYTLKGDDTLYTAPVKTPISQFEIKPNTNNYALLLNQADMCQDFRPENLERFDLDSAFVTIDLVRSSGPIGRTGVTTRFGAMTFKPSDVDGSSFNGNLFTILFTVFFSIAYLVIVVILFFWWKRHYRNDEFRRLNPKKFIKSASIGYVSLTIIALAIMFIVLRFVAFNNAIVVFNPVDPFVIGFGAVSIVIIGYLIKFLWTQRKAMKARKMSTKLKLDQDKNEDGTN